MSLQVDFRRNKPLRFASAFKALDVGDVDIRELSKLLYSKLIKHVQGMMRFGQLESFPLRENKIYV